MMSLTIVETQLTTLRLPPALDALREVTLQAVSTSSDPLVRARNITRLAHSTELAVLFKPRITLPYGYDASPRPSPRRLPTIASALDTAAAHVATALEELHELGVGRGYLNILETHARAQAMRARVAAVCAILVVAVLVAPAA